MESDQKGADLVVSRTTLANPRPDVDVIGAEYVSLLGPSSAYVLAVTVSDGGPKPTGKARRTTREIAPFSFVVQNAAGEPQPGTLLEFSFLCDGFAVWLAPLQVNDNGRVILDVPTDVVRAVRYRVRLPDGGTEAGEVEVLPGEKESPVQTIHLP